MSLVDSYRGLATCCVGNGSTMLLWKDIWKGHILELKFPHLHSFAENEDISMKEGLAINSDNTYDMFQLPLSVVAHNQLMELQGELNSIQITDDKDTWKFLWGDTKYNTKKVYNALIGSYPTHKTILDIWKTCCVPRQKFFAWLLLYDRLNTKELMKRKNFYVEFQDCVLCDTCPDETSQHLFFDCSFSQSFWWNIGIEWNTDLNIHDMIQDAIARYTSVNFLMEIFITGCWSLWDQRNGLIFKDQEPSCGRCTANFKDYFFLHLHIELSLV